MARAKIKEIKITQIKSAIGSPINQKATIEALGIKRMHQTVQQKATPQILGMINTVRHLVVVENV